LSNKKNISVLGMKLYEEECPPTAIPAIEKSLTKAWKKIHSGDPQEL